VIAGMLSCCYWVPTGAEKSLVMFRFKTKPERNPSPGSLVGCP
jgi:hypothetical protein